MTVLSTVGLAVALDGRPVLHGVDLSVESGEWVTVIGPNGAGKSTLLRAILGLVPVSGSVSLSGTPAARLRRRDRARLVAYVPQSPVVPPGMSVHEYVLLGRTPYVAPLGRESRHDLDVVRGVLARLDLAGFADRPLERLSGGERQRVFLARAIAQGATLLLLDEPTTALDIGHQQEVLDLVDELRRGPLANPDGADPGAGPGGGLAVLATMHDLSLAGGYADRLVLLAAGRVVASGPPAAVLTEDLLATHYAARVRVFDGAYGPLVMPVRTERTSHDTQRE